MSQPDTDAPRTLSIAEAARAAGTDRYVIRRKLHGGEFPGAFKDAQGFWRIPEQNLLDAGLPVGDTPPTRLPAATEFPTAPALQLANEEVMRLRAEVDDLRQQLERVEAQLEAERRVAEERARALEVERRTLEGLLFQVTGQRPEPIREERRRTNWQADFRAARAREAQLKAMRAREAEQRAGAQQRREPVAVATPSATAAPGPAAPAEHDAPAPPEEPAPDEPAADEPAPDEEPVVETTVVETASEPAPEGRRRRWLRR
jgi:hypothetical protein